MKLREKVARLIYRAESDKRDGSRVTDDEADDDWRTLDEGTRELYFRTADAIRALYAEDRRELVEALRTTRGAVAEVLCYPALKQYVGSIVKDHLDGALFVADAALAAAERSTP